MTTTQTYLLGLGTVVSAIYAFYTGTLDVIFQNASTQYQSAVYIFGFFLIISVPIYQWITKKWVMDVSRRNLMLILIMVLLVQPFIIQGVYDPSDYNIYGDYDLGVADHHTLFGYYNTSGYQITASAMVETAIENGTWSTALVSTAQDNDLPTQIRIYIDEGTVHSYINATAFDPDTDDHIVAVGVRVTGGTNGIPLEWNMGFSSDPTFFRSQDDSLMYTSDTRLSMYYVTAYDLNRIDSFPELSDDYFRIGFYEKDANVFVNGEDIEIEVHFYYSLSSDTFNEYLLYCGVINILIAFAMTKYWNPTGTRRYRYNRRRFGSYRSRFRRNRYYRPRNRRFRRYRRFRRSRRY